MKTKVLFFLVTLFAALSVSAQDSVVIINGVRWATRNVDAPGTFAKSPEDGGIFYQWNSKVGWPATGTLNGWNSNWNGGYTTASDSDTWTSTNDPSPAGYRVPTNAEMQTLLDTAKVTNEWTTQNGVDGRKFTDKTTGNSIFFPASGYRYYNGGTLSGAGSNGGYWGGSASYCKAETFPASSVGGYFHFPAVSGSNSGLFFRGGSVDWYNRMPRACGMSIRPVVK